MLISKSNYFSLFTKGVEISPTNKIPYIMELLIMVLLANILIITKIVNTNNAIILNFIFLFSFIGLFLCSIGAYIKININTDRNINILINWFNIMYFDSSAVIVNDNSEM